MLWVNFFIAFFPAHRGSILWNIIPGEDAYTGLWIRSLTLFNFGFSFIIVILKRKFKSSIILGVLFSLWIFFILSKFFNLFRGDVIGIIAIPVEYLAIYMILDNEYLSKKTLNIVLFFSAVWLAIPLLLFIFGPINIKLSFISYDHGRFGTYGGFALHRNYFGYYSGLVMLLFLLSKTNKWLKVFVSLICIISIFFSTSRSAIVCIIISSSLFLWLTYKKWRLPLLIAVGCVGLTYYTISSQVQIRTGDITSTSDREELVKAFTDSIHKNPVWGIGTTTMHYSDTYPKGSQAHNFILQVWNDYGIVVLILFCTFWGTIFVLGDKVVKTFILYLILFGLFQPYFMLNIPTPFMWINIFFIILVSYKNRLRHKLYD